MDDYNSFFQLSSCDWYFWVFFMFLEVSIPFKDLLAMILELSEEKILEIFSFCARSWFRRLFFYYFKRVKLFFIFLFSSDNFLFLSDRFFISGLNWLFLIGNYFSVGMEGTVSVDGWWFFLINSLKDLISALREVRVGKADGWSIVVCMMF